MRKQIAFVMACMIGSVVCGFFPDDLGFEGHDLVEPDCDAMSHFFECRNIDTAPPDVFLGYLYMHHTSATLGPNGSVRYSDTGEPYVNSVMACSSCHFTGGHVPFGATFYQTPSKFKPDPETGLGPYFRPLGHYRDVEDAIIDCMRNCINAGRSPDHNDPVVQALVTYIEWVSDGIIDPAMQEDWTLLPPEAGTKLSSIDGVFAMRADPVRGATLYANQCADCHDEDGPGAGEYREDEERPRVPPLWGLQNGYSHGAAFFRSPVLAGYVQKHMPYGDPETLSDQDALDIAAYINSPGNPRPEGQSDEMYCHDDPDGIPSALRKPADWLVGCEYPGEREYFEDQGIDFDDMVLNGPWDELAAWRAAEVERLLAEEIVANQFNVVRGIQVGGNLTDTHISDDSYLQFNPGITLSPIEPPVWIEFLAAASNGSPSALSFTIESSVNTVSVQQTIELFDFSTGQYESVDSRNATLTDSHIQLDLDGDVSRFVENGSNHLKARIGWKANGPVFLFPWRISIDHISWNVTD